VVPLYLSADAATKAANRRARWDTGKDPERLPEVAKKECDPADRETGGGALEEQGVQAVMTTVTIS